MGALTSRFLADLATVWAPVLDALDARRVTAAVEYLGGGCVVIEVPLAEDHTRWAWIGTMVSEDEDGPWISDDTVFTMVGGIAYGTPPDGAPGDLMSDRLTEPCGVGGEVFDADAVADAIAALARRLAIEPTIHLI